MCMVGIALALVGGMSSAGDQPRIDTELDRLRLFGAAHYENDQFKDAVAAYRRILELAPTSAIDHFNLGLVLMRDAQYDAALEALGRAVEIDPELTAAIYVRGIVYKRQGNFREAVASLRAVIERDPLCFGAFYNLGLSHKLLEEFDNAQESFHQAIALDPEHPSPYYQMIILARRSGDVEEARRLSEIFDRLRDTIDESEKTVEALERSRYSYILEAPRFGQDLEPQPDAEVLFVEVTDQALPASSATNSPPLVPERVRRDEYDAAELGRRYAAAVGGAVALRDVDADGHLDIYVGGCAASDEGSANRFYRGLGGGRFRDETAGFGLGDAHCATDAIFGDLDNDGHDDLYVVNAGPNVLYRKQGDGTFEGRGDEASNGLAVLTLSEPLPVAFAVEVAIAVREHEAGKHNAFLILDYRGPEDFKFVGARVDEGYWTIGHFDGVWVDDARLDSGIAPDEFHALRLRIDGGRVELLPGFAGGDKNLVHDFGTPLHRGRIGFGVDGAVARFDDLRIGPLSVLDAESREATPPDYAERFADGVADGFTAESGSWQVIAWGFDEVASEARVDEPQFGRRGVLIDYDHDNDLDIYLANEVEFTVPIDGDELLVPQGFAGQVNTLLRNNGNGTFADQTDESGLLVTLSRSHDVVFGDFDGDSDTDLLVVHADAPSRLFTNLRLGRFTAGGSFDPPLERDSWAAATGDFNRDGHLDLVVAVGDRVVLYTNDGEAHFKATPVLVELPGGVGMIKILDFNNDGWTDLLLVPRRGEGLALLAATGPAAFRDVSARVGLTADLGTVAAVALGDLDGDGDQDLVALGRDGGLRVFDSRGGNRLHWLDIYLVGKKVNRNGYGATLEIASEGHYQKYLIDEGRIHLGLGELAAVDVVRVIWPNGVAQNVVTPGINTAVTIEEYVKVSASCGFLWASAGAGFELINEILGIGPLGAPIASGVYHQPDSTELTLITGDQLTPRDGRYELRLTEELREIMYADQITLRVIDHPAELEIVPNEKFVAPPFPEDRFFALADARPPRAAVDDEGRDVLDLVAHRDGRFPTFPRHARYDGLAEPHALILDLGELDEGEQVLLFLDGWIYWPEASVSMAVAQDPGHEIRPLELQVRNARGEWETAMTVGLPTSKGLVVPVEITPLLPLASPQIRLTTNMSIYFDRIFVATRDQSTRCRTTELPVEAADLHYRGFSRLDRDEVGYERFDYDDVRLTGSWNPPRGMFTRYGDVTPLLKEPDDRYAIFGPGDELIMTFDAGAVPDLPAGWKRDYIFYADGWVKDGDLNTKYSGTVEPLPFHGMSGYPYPETEHYPRTPETEAYLREYNTRPAVPTVGRLLYTGWGTEADSVSWTPDP